MDNQSSIKTVKHDEGYGEGLYSFAVMVYNFKGIDMFTTYTKTEKLAKRKTDCA